MQFATQFNRVRSAPENNDGKTSADKYSFRKEIIPLESGEKDPTDFMAHYGVEPTKTLLKKLIDGNH